MSSQIEALIFDCDGTVLNSMEFYWPTWVETCKKYNIHITKRKFYECSGLPVKTIYETYVGFFVTNIHMIHTHHDSD